jgi:hypothetical protein
MNFLDTDFPEVTEAYRGSFEDWLELFERYAFPRTGDTETTAEMKRIFKRYPEITYEDWLDRVIKSVRDELWYEEKINLSTRELYLVVNKVARLDKKLRAFYTMAFNTEITNLNEAQNAGIAKLNFLQSLLLHMLYKQNPQTIRRLIHYFTKLLNCLLLIPKILLVKMLLRMLYLRICFLILFLTQLNLKTKRLII